MNNTLPELPKNLQDFCNLRDQALSLINTAERALKDAEQVCNEAGQYVMPHELRWIDFEQKRREMDAGFWRMALDRTNFKQIMDRQALKEFHDAISETSKNPPPFTADTVRETFLNAAVNRNELMVRGIVNVFSSLSTEYRSNDAFKVAPKIVVRCMFANHFGRVGFSTWWGGADKLCDIDRIFRTLDGKKYEPRALEFAIEASFKQTEKGHQHTHEDEYFRIKGHKNGNAHIEFKRADLLEKVNLLIADWYGPRAVAARRNAA